MRVGGSIDPKIKAAIIRSAMVGVVYEGYHCPHSEGLRGVVHTPGSSAGTLQVETTASKHETISEYSAGNENGLGNKDH